MTDGAPVLERVLRHERLVTAGGLAVLSGLAWVYLIGGAGMGMSAWEMTTLSLFPHKAALAANPMASMSMAEMPSMRPPDWDAGRWALTTAMWWVMMIAMMTPSAAPTVLLYGRVQRTAAAQGRAHGLAPTWSFVAGYLLIWLGFSLAAAGLHWGLEREGLISAGMMGSQNRWLSAGVLAAAGLYQLSPLQGLCLDHCRNPASFLSRHWRPGLGGAVRLGALHGAWCVGCCWGLMALLFVGGVMNLAWIAAITLLVLGEKVLPGGRWVGRAAGAVLIVWAVATLMV